MPAVAVVAVKVFQYNQYKLNSKKAAWEIFQAAFFVI
jgi:hypothetical protein